jgi:hypothetical protein
MCGGVDLGYILPVFVGVYARFGAEGIAGSRPAFEKASPFLSAAIHSLLVFFFIFFTSRRIVGFQL